MWLVDGLRTRRLFRRMLESNLDIARKHWNENSVQIGANGRRRHFSSTREFLKFFGESHAKQYDDVQKGASDPTIRRLSPEAWDLICRKCLEVWGDIEKIAKLRSWFKEYYSEEEELIALIEGLKKTTNRRMEKLLKGANFGDVVSGSNDIEHNWMRHALRIGPYGNRTESGVLDALTILLEIERRRQEFRSTEAWMRAMHRATYFGALEALMFDDRAIGFKLGRGLRQFRASGDIWEGALHGMHLIDIGRIWLAPENNEEASETVDFALDNLVHVWDCMAGQGDHGMMIAADATARFLAVFAQVDAATLVVSQ
ncbi:MAG: hypothetical protein ABL907_03975, partial [Hyphomicrobium sp.]